MTDNPQYKPGDVANGHRLGEDNVWHPVDPYAASHAAPAAAKGTNPILGWMKRHKVLTGIGAFVLFAILISPFTGTSGGGEGTGSVAAAAATESASPTPTEEPTEVATTEAAEEETPTPTPTKTKAPAQPKAKEISARALAKIMKNPEAHAGEQVIVYGEIMQFDSLTGVDQFLAYTANRDTTEYGFFDGELALYGGDEDRLADFVEGDVFRATITVLTTYSYDTQIGGNTTVPVFLIDSIKRVGSNA